MDAPGWWQRSQRFLYPPVSYSQAAGGWVDADPNAVGQSPQMRRVGSPRPAYSALTSERGMLLPSLDRAIKRYLNERIQ
ncbi:hypothetical protein [Kovacikia minuta]|uniref:hypothetical protein n=1 Tax=Kovacikia minuta TaxID=2931930 RepID=UPI0028F3F3CA|nr:hypothetical protein [Kovacikia minuta]